MINLDDKIRFTNAGWVLVGLFPVPSKKAGNYKGKMTFAKRKNMLFHGKLFFDRFNLTNLFLI
jgi:hypothetical protein